MRSPKSSSKKCRAIRYSNKFQYCFETSLQRIWTTVPQANTKVTHLTSVMKKKRLDFARRHRYLTLVGWKKVLFSEECTLSGHWLSILAKHICCSHNEIPAEPNDLRCHVVPWRCWSVFHSAQHHHEGTQIVELLKEKLKLHVHGCTIFMQDGMNEWMNECLMTPQHEKQIGYWVSEKGKCMKWLYAR